MSQDALHLRVIKDCDQQGYSAAVLASHASRTAETSCAYLLPHVKVTDNILDVGCGPGTITISLAAYNPQGRITGLDTSPEVVEIANKQPKLPANCSFIVGNVYALPFPDNSFDVVHAHQVLVHLPDAPKALAEMRRVCRPGGIVACREGDWDGTILFPEDPVLNQWKKIAEQVYRSAGSEPNAGRRLISWAIEGGFREEKVSYSMGSQTYAGQAGAGWWGESFAQRCSGKEWREKVLQQKLATDEEITKTGDAWRAWSKTPSAVYSIPCGQIVCVKSE